MNWPGRVALIAPHPDDEAIGAASQWRSIPDLWIVHATNGAPANMSDAQGKGFSSREAYAEARRAESLAALALAGIESYRLLQLGFNDQETAFGLVELTKALARLLRDLKPEAMLIPAYEGGHPDHDSVAFAAHRAVRIQESEWQHRPRLIEYALYHDRGGSMHTGGFLPESRAPVTAVELDGETREFKRRLFDCFASQRDVLAYFPLDCESFRPAPEYDFTRAPHAGRLWYERFDWGMDGETWREKARQALAFEGVY